MTDMTHPMPLKKKFVLLNTAIRERCIAYLYDLPLDTCPHGWKVMITENVPNKSREQEEKYHAQLEDIRKSGKFVFMGRTDWTKSEVKSLLKEAFANVMLEAGTPLRHQPKMTPSLDGKRIVALEPSSKEFTVSEASEFISFLSAYGDDLGVTWSEQ